MGEEVASARALSDLVHQLLDKAAGEIEEVTHEPTHLHV
ncbi:MAG: dsRBD fold-containing protein [bacterium]